MTASDQAVQEHGTTCWCCGEEYDEQQLVRLGEHPEVALCLSCTQWARRRAVARVDAGSWSPGARLRSVVRAVRGFVMERQWQDGPVVGRVLRWVDRFLP